MYRKYLLLLLLLLSEKVMALEFPIQITEYIDDVKVNVNINKNDIKDELQWIPFEGPPPLSIFDTLDIVQAYLESSTDFVTTSLIGIELKQIPHHELHWHYLVNLKCKTADKSQPCYFVVLMDRKVIPATILPN